MKMQLRKQYIEIRKNILNKEYKCNQIYVKFLNSSIYKKSKSLALYASLQDEVDTFNIIQQALVDHKRVFLPKVINQTKMEFYEIQSLNDCIKGYFGILEPNTDKKIDKHEIDCIVIPGVCFDRQLNRIGFGKGYYDRYLQDMDVMKVGLCFEEQIMNGIIETDEYDIKMNQIITDQKIYECRNISDD